REFPRFRAHASGSDRRRSASSSHCPLGRIRDHRLTATRVAAPAADEALLSRHLAALAGARPVAPTRDPAGGIPLPPRAVVAALAYRPLGRRARLRLCPAALGTGNAAPAALRP